MLHDVVAGGGDLVPLQEVLGEGLASLELRRRPRRSEDGETAALELVDEPEDQGKLRTHDGEADRELLREVRELDDIRGVDGDAVGLGPDPGVPGSAIDLADLRALPELPDEGVLPPPSAYDEDSQGRSRFGTAEVKASVISKLRLLVQRADYPIEVQKVSTMGRLRGPARDSV
jgi:hypothetical protein